MAYNKSPIIKSLIQDSKITYMMWVMTRDWRKSWNSHCKSI